MDSVLEKLKDIVQVERLSEGLYNVHLPILYYGGDWTVVEVTVNKKSFGVNDKGCALLNAQTIVNNFGDINYTRILGNIIKEYGIEASKTGILSLKDVDSEQLYSAISHIANASQKLSNSIIENAMIQDTKKIHDLVSHKLKSLFKGDYKKKVIIDYEVVGNSSKKYNIPFCIDNNVKRFIEPLNNNATAISSLHTKFFDIGKDSNHSREIIIDEFNNWDTPNIELLKPICEKLNSYNNISI